MHFAFIFTLRGPRQDGRESRRTDDIRAHQHVHVPRHEPHAGGRHAERCDARPQRAHARQADHQEVGDHQDDFSRHGVSGRRRVFRGTKGGGAAPN